jgi:hypothetical protein
MNFQNSIIAGHRLKSNIRMPPITSKFTWFGQWIGSFDRTSFMLYTADDTDLVAQLTFSFRERMDVKS